MIALCKQRIVEYGNMERYSFVYYSLLKGCRQQSKGAPRGDLVGKNIYLYDKYIFLLQRIKPWEMQSL